jgi:hypothetical protein
MAHMETGFGERSPLTLAQSALRRVTETLTSRRAAAVREKAPVRSKFAPPRDPRYLDDLGVAVDF